MGYAHGTKWNDGDVENAIMEIVKTNKLDHFPSKREMIENMFPDTLKLEMFARNTRDGWDCWGEEV